MGLSSLRRRHANCLVGRSAAGLGRAWAACTRKLPLLDFLQLPLEHLHLVLQLLQKAKEAMQNLPPD